MHKPHAMKVGALHDWVELDGEFFSFEKGNNDASKLEKALNDRYLSAASLGQGKDVVVFYQCRLLHGVRHSVRGQSGRSDRQSPTPVE